MCLCPTFLNLGIYTEKNRKNKKNDAHRWPLMPPIGLSNTTMTPTFELFS